jgi:exonuclease III
MNEESQWGGTAVLSLGDVCRYAKGAGEDPTGLGRWCWARFQGQDGITLRCVSVYGPCKSNNGDKSVQQQHIQFLDNNDNTRSPETTFLEDLEADLKIWLAAGDQVLVGGDFNKELTRGTFPAMFQ